MRNFVRVAAVFCGVLAAPAPALAAGPKVAFLPTLVRGVSTTGTTKHWCDHRAAGRGVALRPYVAPMSGFVSVHLRGGRGNWDLGLFDAVGHRRAASLGFAGNELVQAWVRGGERLTIQSCHRAGSGRRAHLAIDFADARLPAAARDTAQLVRVPFSSTRELHRLEGLGLDVTENIRKGAAQVVVDNAAQRALLRGNGFRATTVDSNLTRSEDRARMRDLQYTAEVGENGSPTPSGRTTYRVYSDYQQDLEKLVEQYPAIVKPVVMPHQSFQGRPVQGVEISDNIAGADQSGKPVYWVMGLHHSREWPSAEAAMEFAIMVAHGYGQDDRITDLLKRSRVMIVPIINPDGFISSRQWPLDPADVLGGGGNDPTHPGADNPGLGVDPNTDNPCGGRPTGPDTSQLPEDVCSDLKTCVLTGDDPCKSNLYLAEGIAPPGGVFSYRRKNCDGLVHNPAIPCELQHGVDPNRNYGQLWGGPGSDADRTSQSYRGEGMWSEPETQNVHEFSQRNPITALITLHNVAALVLRPPGLHDNGLAPDEPRLKQLGDQMADDTGYTSEYGYQLYDTAGTTEDWNYAAAGTYGYTIELGPANGEFHMPYQTGFVDQWNGDYSRSVGKNGKGLREALMTAWEAAANRADHSVVEGATQPGRVLRLHRNFKTSSYTSPFCKETVPLFLFNIPATDGPRCLAMQDPFEVDDFLDYTMTVPASGHFQWDVTPSTRPFVGKDTVQEGPPVQAFADKVYNGDGSGAPSTPVTEASKTIPFEITAEEAATHMSVDLTFDNQAEDYDLDLCKYDSQNQCQPFGNGTTGIGSSGQPNGTPEHIDADAAAGDTLAGRYEAKVSDYTSVSDSWKLTISGTKPGSSTVVPGKKEAYTLTCETPTGQVLESHDVVVDRGQALGVAFDGPCAVPSDQGNTGGGSTSGDGSGAGNSGGTDGGEPGAETPPSGTPAVTMGGPGSPRSSGDAAAKRRAGAKRRAAARRRAAAKRRAARRRAAAKRRCLAKAKKLHGAKRARAIRRCRRAAKSRA